MIAVVDESGATNRPTTDPGRDFSIAGLVIEREDIAPLARIHDEIAEATRNGDFKYKHVAGNPAARAVIERATAPSATSSRVYLFYAAGASMSREAERVAGMRLDSPKAGADPFLAAFRASPTNACLRNFLSFSVPCLAAYAKHKETCIEVYFDQRTDMPFIKEAVAEYLAVYRDARPEYDIRPHIDFRGECPRDLRKVCRLAGVYAGDAIRLFQQFGQFVWRLLHGDGFSKYISSVEERLFQQLGVIPVGRLSNRFGTGIDLLLPLYQHALVSNLLSFASPTGICGHLAWQGRIGWIVNQLPD